jgi:hypothetical protein
LAENKPADSIEYPHEVQFATHHEVYTTTSENAKRIISIELPATAVTMEDGSCRLVDETRID